MRPFVARQGDTHGHLALVGPVLFMGKCAGLTSNSGQKSPAEKDQDQSKESRPVRLQRHESNAQPYIYILHHEVCFDSEATGHCQRTPIPWVYRAAAFPNQERTARKLS